MKKSLLLASLCGISLFSTAYADMYSPVVHSGFFVGAAGTIVAPTYGYKPIASDVSTNSSNTLLRPDVFAGYSDYAASKNLYMGFEVGMQVGTSKSQQVARIGTSPDAATNHVKEGNVFYADIMPGFVVGNESSVLYGIIGATDGSFTLSTTNGQGAQIYNQAESHFGYRFGLGYNYNFTNDFAVGVKYVYSDFGNIKYNGGSAFQYELNPHNNAISLGVSYTFGDGSDNGEFLN